jgi:hypothetical protein
VGSATQVIRKSEASNISVLLLLPSAQKVDRSSGMVQHTQRSFHCIESICLSIHKVQRLRLWRDSHPGETNPVRLTAELLIRYLRQGYHLSSARQQTACHPQHSAPAVGVTDIAIAKSRSGRSRWSTLKTDVTKMGYSSRCGFYLRFLIRMHCDNLLAPGTATNHSQ